MGWVVKTINGAINEGLGPASIAIIRKGGYDAVSPRTTGGGRTTSEHHAFACVDVSYPRDWATMDNYPAIMRGDVILRTHDNQWARKLVLISYPVGVGHPTSTLLALFTDCFGSNLRASAGSLDAACGRIFPPFESVRRQPSIPMKTLHGYEVDGEAREIVGK